MQNYRATDEMGTGETGETGKPETFYMYFNIFFTILLFSNEYSFCLFIVSGTTDIILAPISTIYEMLSTFYVR